MDNCNTKLEKCQEDKLYNELTEKFTPKRQSAELLAQSYERIGYENKAQRVSECGTWLEFKKAVNAVSRPLSAKPVAAEAVGTADGWKLHNANFCRDRLCPMCSWRRSYKIFGQVSQIMDVIADDYYFIFLTLTVPNCEPDKLSDTLDALQEGWRRFIRYKPIKMAVRGYFKALETTRNKKNGTYHPHLHNILAVDKNNYFNGREYIKRDEWLQMWQKAMRDPSITQVDVRRCKTKEEIKDGEMAVKALSSAVAEVAKYSVKSSDYLIPGDKETTDNVVTTLGAALNNRRLCAFGGIFDDVRKKLNLDDCENGDLIHVDESEIRSDVAVMIRKYGWSCGAYKLIEERREVNINIGGISVFLD